MKRVISFFFLMAFVSGYAVSGGGGDDPSIIGTWSDTSENGSVITMIIGNEKPVGGTATLVTTEGKTFSFVLSGSYNPPRATIFFSTISSNAAFMRFNGRVSQRHYRFKKDVTHFFGWVKFLPNGVETYADFTKN